MLSRVIGFRDSGNIDLQPFAPAPLSRATSDGNWSETPGGTESDTEHSQRLNAEAARLTAENALLNSRIASLDAQLAVGNRDSFDAGCRQGEQRARLEVAPVIEKMNQAIGQTIGAREEARRRAERDVVNLAVLIARRVLHREIAIDPNALTALAKVVFERMARAESYTLTIHPQFLQAVQSVLSSGQLSKVKIDPDPSCPPGSFVVRSPEGTIDASIDTQLDEISRGLADRLAES